MPNDALATPLSQRYRLLEKLGEGSMGAVFKAHDAKLDRTVAIKIMAVDLVKHPDALARFQREARALAKVSHPGIVQAFDCGEDRGQHFLVMEYVDGRSLMEVLRGHGKIPPTIAADHVHQAALALYHAHERGLIHRDIKPLNLLLATSGQVKVLDLGLARFAQDHLGESALTRENSGMGTPDYMAPEQFTQAHHADARSDIYSLGCTLFHLITGQVPFPGTSLAGKMRAHEEQEPPSIEELCPEAPVGLALTIRRMLAKKPADRFQTMLEVAEALAPYVAGSSISLSDLKKTSDWSGSQLSFHELPDRSTKPSSLSHRDTPVPSPASTTAQASKRSRLLKYGVIGLAAVLLVGLLAGLPFLLRTVAPPAEPKDTGGTNGIAENEVAPPAAPNVLTVSKDPRHKAQFDTINAALEQVEPGQTVRVLDAGTYEEAIILRGRDRFERLTLESTRGARIRVPESERAGIIVHQLPKLTLRGFEIEAHRKDQFCLVMLGNCAAAKVERLTLTCKRGDAGGVLLEDVLLPDPADALVIQHCTVRGGFVGIQLFGVDLKSPQSLKPRPCRGVILQNNRLHDCTYGIALAGQLSDLMIVGNQIWNCATAVGFPFDLLHDSGNMLFANNTSQGMGQFVQFGEMAKGLQGIEFRNNLLLSEGANDITFVGKDRSVLDQVRFDHNWRQVRLAAPGSAEAAGLIGAANDQIRDKIELLSTDPKSPDFLRPAADSPLATGGAGKDDPSLPLYVGAVPPKGVDPWDWNATWRWKSHARK